MAKQQYDITIDPLSITSSAVLRALEDMNDSLKRIGEALADLQGDNGEIGLRADLSLGGNRVVDVADPVDTGDAVTLSYLRRKGLI